VDASFFSRSKRASNAILARDDNNVTRRRLRSTGHVSLSHSVRMIGPSTSVGNHYMACRRVASTIALL
jgi:hypothetical protein